MSKAYAALALVLVLAACGRSGGAGGAHQASGDACGLIAHADALFGANFTSSAASDVGDASCAWVSANGQRGGGLIVFSGASLEGKSAADFLAQTGERWGAAQPDFPLEAISGLGEEAKAANHLPGYQTQIVLRKGERVVAIQAWSGDPALSTDQLAQGMAQAAAGALQ